MLAIANISWGGFWNKCDPINQFLTSGNKSSLNSVMEVKTVATPMPGEKLSLLPDANSFGTSNTGNTMPEIELTHINVGSNSLSENISVETPFQNIYEDSYSLPLSEAHSNIVGVDSLETEIFQEKITLTDANEPSINLICMIKQGNNSTLTNTSTLTITTKPTNAPLPVNTPTQTPIVGLTKLSVVGNEVTVFDNKEESSGDLTNTTDFDQIDNRNLTIHSVGDTTGANDWHVYFRKGFGGMKYLGRTGNGSDTSLEWYPNAPLISEDFANGPDINSMYTFRMICIDGQLGPDDVYDMKGVVGYNIEGGNPIALSQPDLPYLNVGEVAIYDDILGGNNLALMGEIGEDSDMNDWRALQIAWNFGVDASQVSEYHIMVSIDGGDYEFLGQTGTGKLNYFWWTPSQEFITNPKYIDGPQNGNTYQFKIFLLPMEGGSRQKLTSGKVVYRIDIDEENITATSDISIIDNREDSSGDLTGQTDFDALDNRNLTIHYKGNTIGANDWHVYFRKGFGGMKYLGRTGSGSDASLEWYPNAPLISEDFANGPDINSIYTFRMIRIDGQLGPDDIFNMKGVIGFNLEGGNDLTLSQPDLPYLNVGEVAIYDDILGGNNLALMGEIGEDSDMSDWRALQIAWNFGIDASQVSEYHVMVSIDGGNYEFLGQTGTGKLNYFWWTPNEEFKINPKFANGPEGGHTYQFKIFLLPVGDTSRSNLTSGKLEYNVIEDEIVTPTLTPTAYIPTSTPSPTPHEELIPTPTDSPSQSYGWVKREIHGECPPSIDGLAYEPNRNVIVALTTLESDGIVTGNQIWEWDNVNWKKIDDCPGLPLVKPVSFHFNRYSGLNFLSEPDFDTMQGNELWIRYDDGIWEIVPPTPADPYGRFEPGICLLEYLSGFVMFGGLKIDGTYHYTFDDQWINLYPETFAGGIPWNDMDANRITGRSFQSMTFYPPTNEIVMFGGRSYGGECYSNPDECLDEFDDTWLFIDWKIWTKVETVTHPSKRCAHNAVYDATQEKIILFGGYSHLENEFYDDTWEWDGAGWKEIIVDNHPPAGLYHMVFNPSNEKAILFNLSENGINEIWEYTSSPKSLPDLVITTAYSGRTSYDCNGDAVVVEVLNQGQKTAGEFTVQLVEQIVITIYPLVGRPIQKYEDRSVYEWVVDALGVNETIQLNMSVFPETYLGYGDENDKLFRIVTDQEELDKNNNLYTGSFLIYPPCSTEPPINDPIEDIPLNLPEGAVPLEMVYISSGDFMMGSPETDDYLNSNELPQHKVEIFNDFYIGKHEITQAQWTAVMGYNPSFFNDDINKPVDSVSWHECQMFIKKLNLLLSSNYRLPTEEEWEYACRADYEGVFYWGDDPDGFQISNYAWFEHNASYSTHPVGQKLPNACGLYDMIGNVLEWCDDAYMSYDDKVSEDDDKTIYEYTRILRGGSWQSVYRNCRSAARLLDADVSSHPAYGFRIAHDIEE